ncbi:MAG: hypothetical protein E7051_06105 [Lentisphaerae bacterium]|nr:hypothetical protein [Lentisphaerota bacterium]
MDLVYKNLEKRLTLQNAHYFFGYFDRTPWNSRNEHPVHKVPFSSRQPRFGEAAEIGIMKEGAYIPVSKTLSWCWQQGSMLQWFDDDRLIFNDVIGDRFGARLTDGTELALPVYILSNDRRYALSLNFARLETERPGYGYPGIEDPFRDWAFHPQDGVVLMDLQSGENKIVVSTEQLVNDFYAPGIDTAMNWVNHLTFSPDGKKIAFIHRFRCFGPWGKGFRCYVTRIFTADCDGSNLQMLNIDFHASHYTWCGNDKLVVFSRLPQGGDQYRIYTVGVHMPEIIGRDRMPANGHCSFSPDGKLLLTDSYTEKDGCRELVIYSPEKDERYSLGRYYSPDILQYTRCDLHPRWSYDGKRISFDSFHEKFRGVYAIDLPKEILQ